MSNLQAFSASPLQAFIKSPLQARTGPVYEAAPEFNFGRFNFEQGGG
ncbi:unnamed protein product, partial [marine sediment metagenome]